MLRTVDLDEFAEVLPASSGLLDRFASRSTRQPDAGIPHPSTQRLAWDEQSVALQKLLTGQRRPKIGVLFANNRQNVISEGFRPPVVADLAALLGNQSLRTLGSITSNQAPHLPRRHAEHGGGLSLVQSPIFDAL